MFQYFYHAIETGLKDNKISEREMDRGEYFFMMPQVILVLILFTLGFVIGFLLAKIKGSK